MSTENTPVETQEQSLDDFAATFFSGEETAPESANSESQQDTDDGVDDAQNKDDTQPEVTEGDEPEDTDLEDEDALASEEEDDNEASSNEGQPKKTRFQKRIDELTAKAREEERQRKADKAEYESRIAALEAKLGQDDKATETSTPDASGLVEPSPTDVNEDGTDKYPLGEYDPRYIKDMAKYTFDVEFAQREASRTKNEQQQRERQEKDALQAAWTEKLAPAQERYPDFQERGEQLLETFKGIDASYGEYLTTALMSLDNGPDVLYYLAGNPEEAEAIIASGPMKATVALGRIDSTFKAPTQKSTPAPRKVSKAPAPPPTNKGSAVAKGSINPADDDVDLDALSRELAKRSY